MQGKFSLKYSSRDHGVQLHSLKINFNNFIVMDIAATCKYDWKCRFLLLDGCLQRPFSLAVFYFNYKSMKTTGTLIAKKN